MKKTNKLIFLGAKTSLFPAEVTHLEAEINYTKVYTANGQNLVLSSTMKSVMECLQEHGDFIRISRKHVVNMEFVKSTRKDSLTLINGLKLNPSRRKRRQLNHLFS